MPSHFRRLAGVVWLVLALLGMAACAPLGSGSGSANPTPGSADLNGCAAQHAPAGVAGKSADLVVTQGGDYTGQPVALRQGQTLEVRLPATINWGMQTRDADGILTTSEATGWYDATLRDCLWRFTAVKAGSVTLNFAGGPVCAPNTACPAIAAVQQYNITVR
jgi:hypothetical protein